MNDFAAGFLAGAVSLMLLGLCAAFLTLAFDAMGGFKDEGKGDDK